MNVDNRQGSKFVTVYICLNYQISNEDSMIPILLPVLLYIQNPIKYSGL